MKYKPYSIAVLPAKAGIQGSKPGMNLELWIPAFAGKTESAFQYTHKVKGDSRLRGNDAKSII